jgi:protocatechuate 3,4-dioxygenase beta subunit
MPLNRRALLFLAVVAVSVPVTHGWQNPRPRPATPARDPGAEKAPPVGTASISGTVTLAGAGLPARRARVTLSGGEVGRPRMVIADQQGRFAFSTLPAGRYSLSAAKPGHLPAMYGQSQPGRPGTPIQLGEGQKFEAGLQLTRGGVLTGTVLDEDGDAIPGTQVRAMRYVMQNGARTLQPSGNGSTDDRGIYRIFGLPPGDYVVGATPRNVGGPPNMESIRAEIAAIRQNAGMGARGNGPLPGNLAARLAALQSAEANLAEEPTTGYAPVYYPGTTALAQAAPIALGAGEERANVDFQMQRVAVARVEGFVMNSTGQALQNIQITLTDTSHNLPGVGGNLARAEDDGRFSFSNVAPGHYRISARAVVREPGERGRGGPAGRPVEPARFWAAADVTVDGRDIINVALALQPGMTATGRVVFEGTSLPQPTDLTRLRVNVIPADIGAGRDPGGPVGGRVDASGKFVATGITPGRYRLNASGAPQGWMLESAIVEGQDTLDFPFEVKPGQNVGSATVTFTDRRSELSGMLQNSSGQAATGYTLILFPADQRFWIPQSRRIRTARPATDGQFLFGSLPPGDYKIATVVDVEPGAWQDPAYLQQLETGALRVSVAEGERKVQNVRISGQ